MTLQVALRHTIGAFDLDVDFTCPAGVTAIFGRSGAGKTSIINAIAGLTPPDRGRIALGGRVLTDTHSHIPSHKRRIGYVFQDARLFPHLSVRRNLTFGAKPGQRAPTFDDIVGLLGLEAVLDRRPRTLSGGEAQRVALGRALLSAPDLLLLDEPLAALDDPRKQDILPYLEGLRAGPFHIPILYVSHSLDEVARLADHLILLENGRIMRQGPIMDVLGDPSALPYLGVRQAGAMIEATVTAHGTKHGTDGLSTLRTSAGQLELPGIAAPIGTRLRLRVMAQDVILSDRRPSGLSSRNVLPAVIQDIHIGGGPGAAVALVSGSDRLLARVTARAVREMNLHQGQAVFAIFKATTVAPLRIGR